MGKQRKQDSELRSKYRAIKLNGKRVDMHRHIMEEHLGRGLTRDEVVHHIDGNPMNNDLSNLVVMSRSEHTKLHMKDAPNLHILTTEDRRRITIERWSKGAYDNIKKAVVSFDKKTKELVKIYTSETEVIKDGHDNRHIGACCSGHRKSHHGLIWRYLTDCPDLKI